MSLYYFNYLTFEVVLYQKDVFFNLKFKEYIVNT